MCVFFHTFCEPAKTFDAPAKTFDAPYKISRGHYKSFEATLQKLCRSLKNGLSHSPAPFWQRWSKLNFWNEKCNNDCNKHGNKDGNKNYDQDCIQIEPLVNSERSSENCTLRNESKDACKTKNLNSFFSTNKFFKRISKF